MTIWLPIAGVIVSVVALWHLWPSVMWSRHVRAAFRKIDAGSRRFQRLIESSGTKHFDRVLHSAEIVFREGDEVRLRARIQVVGTLGRGEWLWSWANPSIPDNVSEAARSARTLGRREGFKSLTTARFPCSEEEAEALGAVTAALSGAEAVTSHRTDRGALLYLLIYDAR